MTTATIMTSAPIMTTAPITTATGSTAERAISVLVLAFSSDPACRWAWPEPRQYLTSFPGFVRAFAGRAFEHGTAYCLRGYAGAALWLPPGVYPDEETVAALLRATVAEPDQADLFAVFEQMAGYHPSEPHWYLPLIGVDPRRQGRGYGSELMRHALAACDRDGMPAYLESTNPANISLYERHGFEALGTIQVGASPPIFPMLRTPR
jgi:ribosomal protein S18 acetylase RimI-like enzyme